MAMRENEPAVAGLVRALVNAYFVSRANRDETTASALLEGLRGTPALTASPAVRAIVERRGNGSTDAAELDLLRAMAGQGEDAARLTVSALIDASPDGSPIAERRILQGLVALGPHSKPALIEALDDERRRGRAAVALGRCGDTRAVAPLIETLADGNPALRRAAAETLGELGDPAAARALLAARHDGSDEVRAAAVAALRRLGSVALLVEIAETYREAVEQIGGRIHLGRPDSAAGRLRLTIDVPVQGERTGTSSEAQHAETGHLAPGDGDRPVAGEGGDDGLDPTPSDEAPAPETPPLFRPR